MLLNECLLLWFISLPTQETFGYTLVGLHKKLRVFTPGSYRCTALHEAEVQLLSNFRKDCWS